MQPKSYTVFKWAVYALATLLFFALQGLVLDHVRVWGLTPFLYPILPAVEAMYEGPRRGPVFALVMGLFCDILIWGPFEGFYALSFTIIALISAVIGENMLTPGTFCALLVSVGALLGTGGLRVLAHLLSGGQYVRLTARLALGEAIISLPALLLILPVYRTIHRRCAVDY